MGRKIQKFTPEQMKALALNPYTDSVDFRYIWFTEEFLKLFVERYEKGEGSYEIFEDCGYDTDVLGMNRVYNFPRRAMRLLGIKQDRKTLVGAGRQQGTDRDAAPDGQSVDDMQRELEYLRKQVRLLQGDAEADAAEIRDGKTGIPTDR